MNTWLSTWAAHALDFYTRHELFANVFFSGLVIAAFIAVRRIWTASISNELTIETKRKKVVAIRNRLGFAATILIIFIWNTELKTLTVSLLAIAAAVVLATKEVIMSVIGGFVRTTTKQYQVGDRIEIKHYIGDVVDISLLSTTLMEISPLSGVQMYTGKLLHFPHSLLLTEVMRLNHISSNFVTHTFSVPVDNVAQLSKHKAAMLFACDLYAKPYLEEAEANYKTLQEHTSIDMPSPSPKVLIRSDDSGVWWVTCRIVVPVKQAQIIEQDIIQEYLNHVETLEVLDKK